MPEQHGRMLADRYELRVRIGRGTMGTVWRAYDRSLDREIAVKEIRQDPALSPRQRQELRERMLREGRMAARVSHPSVATIHDVILADGIPWIVMELVEGRSLEQVIDEEGPLPPRLVAEIGCDLLSALRAAHAQRILHRDVKPANVLLTETGRVVLTDFGIAKALGDTALTQTGMVIGSPGYTAPERARGDHTGPESDLWSLGATLYFAVEGRPAYERATVGETLAALMTESADPPAQAGPLRPVLEGLLEKDHRARLTPERAAAMLRMIADTPTGASPAPAPAPPARPAGTADVQADGSTDGSADGSADGGANGRADQQARPEEIEMIAPSPAAGSPDTVPSGATPGGMAPYGAGPGSAAPGGVAPGDGEEDVNRTMVVPRPTGVPRVPPAPPRPEPGPDPVGRHDTTVPGRLPGTPDRGPAAAPPFSSAPDHAAASNAAMGGAGQHGAGQHGAGQHGAGSLPLPAAQPPAPPGPHSGPQQSGPQHSGPPFGPYPSAHPGSPGGPLEGAGGHGAPVDGVPGSSSLGTDLFAMRGPSGPDAGTRVRVLVTMGVVLAGLVVLILLAVVLIAK
ncbi:serine/threonine-protein kinase [Microbispora triticiradicis]|uniref:non-specific serine/threonine protein kinase n=2 Tax=Microbispora TaxID=2005 RepID=A0ABY3LS44_9ACTN|nr:MULTISPECIES: serine/threonine-protein kinase [Microbispora]TLP53643.1 serine/threonine protein kinase [Microbispora fusca]TYB51092.1 protein kinase [Microbispora tritici]